MALTLNLTEAGVWELVFYRQITGDISLYRRRPKLPAIAPIEIPFLFERRIFLCGVTNLEKPWYRAGHLYCEIGGIKVSDGVLFPGLQASPSSGADLDRKEIKLNSLELIIFPRVSQQVSLRFEPVPWLDRLTIALWEYRGIETDSTEDLIESLQAQVSTLEFKVDQLR